MTPQGTASLTRRGEQRLLGGHPWIFRSDVAKLEGAEGGGIVRVAGPHRGHLGFAFHSAQSEIRLRVISRAAELPADFLRRRLSAALAWRREIVGDAEAYRILHGEGDGLPSIVVDRYGPFLVIQTLSQTAEKLKGELVDALVAELQPEGILERNDPRVRMLEGLEPVVSLLHGKVPEIVEIKEGGITFAADLWKGQKTGLFLDQRENHLLARTYARGRVLDGFTYNGGFALQVAQVASEVLAVDLSAEALARTKQNAERNGITNVTVRDANAFDVLRELADAGQVFDTVILDPPAFAKSKDAIEKAQRGYKEINLRALKLLRPGGVLITCSCSYHVHEQDLEEILADAAADTGSTVTVVEKRRQARDHPVVLGVPETYYLKCFVLRKLA